MAKRKIEFPKRGEIYLVNFDPTIGSEIQKTRPALILQNDIFDQYSPVTIVPAITSQFDFETYPTEVEAGIWAWRPSPYIFCIGRGLVSKPSFNMTFQCHIDFCYT